MSENESRPLSKTVTLLVPVFNEQEVLPKFYEEINRTISSIEGYEFEILFVDDGSKDDSLIIMDAFASSDTRVSYISLSRNFGKERAMLAGFDACLTDAVIVIDADLQDPPELIPQMLHAWDEGYDDVYARRISREGEGWFKKLSSKMYYKLLQSLTRIDIQPDTGDFRLLDRKCLDALRKLRENERYTKGMFSWIGFKKKEILFQRAPRAAGRTKWNYAGLTRLAVDGVTSFTTAPLKIATFLGFLVSSAAFIYLIIILVQTIFFGISLAGWPSTMATILFLGGVQLLSIGVIGEYVGRIFVETKNRPTYLVQSERRGKPGR